ncbi:MAG: glycosyl hydrolase 115 family protein [Thermoguttaceae bacterium]
MTVRQSLILWSVAIWMGGLSVAEFCQAAEKKESPDVVTGASARFELVAGTEPSPAYIVLAKTEHKGVMAAAKDLQRDVTKVTGVTPNIVHSLKECAGKCVVLGTADCPEGKALLASVGVEVDDLAGRWETYKWRVLNHVGGKDQVLAIAGSNVRGTIFGVYDFEQKHMGVDPWWFWADHEPPTRGELIYDGRIDFGPTKEPTWKYRGWTLNDHPQFMEWMESGIVQRTHNSRYMFAIHKEVLERIMEAALRLKMNMFTWYFIDADWQPDYERLQAVADRGLFLTQQQMEGVGADTGFWDDYWENHNPSGKPKVFSYRKNPEAFQEFWTHYIKRWVNFSPQVVWEIDLRGWADGPYKEPTLPNEGTPQQLSEIISGALADQARLVQKLDPNPDLEMMTTLYYEIGFNYDKGWIKVPKDVTIGFSDLGMMQGMSWSKKFWTEPRDPKRKYGQYFHTQYFGGGPQIAKCTPLDKYHQVNIGAMHQRGDTQHMLLAVNELRHQQIEIRGIAEMLWNYPGFDPREYQRRYCRDEFGPAVADRVSALYDEYYEKFPHKTVDDGFKKIPVYYTIIEPMYTVIGNLHNIVTGTRDGLVKNYEYDREVYERGIRDLGEVLEHARALRPSIPEDRRYFFDYEFLDAIPQVRGVYRMGIAVNDAIARLKNGDRQGALAALNDAGPMLDEFYAAFQHTASTEKWRHWYRSGTNEDVYLLYNTYQKARLHLETEAMNFVTDIEPQRRPYLGNVAMDDPTAVGDQIYGNESSRLNDSLYDGAPFSLVSFPLRDVFQIGGVEDVSRRWKLPSDHGQAYQFTLQGPAKVFVACLKDKPLSWLETKGFQSTGQTMDVGQWGWPYRYQHRPPTKIHTFELFAKSFPAGQVALGKNKKESKKENQKGSKKDRPLPYIVFVQPELLVYENFRGQPIGDSPRGWRVENGGGRASIVANLDYPGEMRDSVFDLSTVRRYRPLDLKSLRLATDKRSTSACTAEIPLRRPVEGDFVVHVRVKPGQTNRSGGFSLQASDGRPVVEVKFSENGRIVCRGASGELVDVAPYEADRWCNVAVRVRGRQGKFDVSVQNDRLKLTERKDLDYAPSAAPNAIRLSQGGEHQTASAQYGAVVGWLE